MCTYRSEQTAVSGSAKGARGWFPLTQATVYFDHPYFTAAEHTLNVDLANPAAGPEARVAIELSSDAARALVACIERALQHAEA